MCLAYVHSQTNPPTCIKFGANRCSRLAAYTDFLMCDHLPPQNAPWGIEGRLGFSLCPFPDESADVNLRPCSHLFRFAFRSRSGPVPLVRVAFTPAKIDRTRSGCGPVTRSHLFRNATGTRTVTHTPPQHTRFLIFGLLSSRRVTLR